MDRKAPLGGDDPKQLRREIAACEAMLRLARAPMDAATLLTRIAYRRYRLAFLPDEPSAESLLAQAIDEDERAVTLAPPRHAERVDVCVAAAHLHMMVASFFRQTDKPYAVKGNIDRAFELARMARKTCDDLKLHASVHALVDNLEAHLQHGAYALVGDRKALQRGLELVDQPGIEHRDLAHAAALFVTQYELTGEPGLIDRGIDLAEKALSYPKSLQRDSLKASLANLLGFRALNRLRDEGSGDSALADAERAVALAGIDMVASGHPTEQRAASLNTLAQAKFVRAEIAEDVRDLSDAVTTMLGAVAASKDGSEVRQLYLNNAAMMMGRLADHVPDLKVGPGRSTRDDAVQLLKTALASSSPTSATASLIRMNLALQLIARRRRFDDKGDTAQALALLREAQRDVQPGHPQRASMLDVFVEASIQAITNDGDAASAPEAIAAAIEAEAISESGAPVGVRRPSSVDRLLQVCAQHDIDPGDLTSKRIRATLELKSCWPEEACRLAVDRGETALSLDNVDAADCYAAIALDSNERAMLVADSPDWAREHAASLGDPACRLARRVAVRVGLKLPARAVLLLERSQASALARIRWSTADLRSFLISGPNAASVDRFLSARQALHRSVAQRRAGMLSATMDALRAAEAEVEDAASGLAGIKGIDGFVRKISSLTDLVRLGAPCVYFVVGDDHGLALFVHRDAHIEQVTLPQLSGHSAEPWLNRYRRAIEAFEDEGTDGLLAFQHELAEVAAWMREAIVNGCSDRLVLQPWTVVPCGTLCGLPWSAVCSELPLGLAPSVQICLDRRQESPPQRCLLVAEPEHDGQAAIPDAGRLHEWLEATLGEPVTLLTGSAATPEAVVAAARLHGAIVFYAHGLLERGSPLDSGVLLHGRSRLDIRAILGSGGAFEGKVIVMASCSQGRFDGEVPSEMLGPSSAFLAAGARVVVAPSWPVEVVSAQTVASGFLQALRMWRTPGVSLVFAQSRLRGAALQVSPRIAGLRRARVHREDEVPINLPSNPGSELFYRAAFAIYGQPR
jgi:hypothetical protein